MKSTKYALVAILIRGRILRGIYTGKLPGERDLAKELKTDHKTVRGALMQLDALGLIRRKPRRGTFVAPHGPDGRPVTQLTAHFLVPAATRSSGGSWLMDMLLSFEAAAAGHGVRMVMESVDAADPGAVVGKALSRSQDLSCVGVCLFDLPVDAAMALKLAEAQEPVVLVDWDIEDPVIPCVVFDNRLAGQLAAEHLLKLGHRRVAFIRYGSHETPSYRDRWAGVQSAFRVAGISIPLMQATTLTEVIAVVGERLRGPEAPTAVILQDAWTAEYLCEAMAKRGVKVPDEVSLIVFEKGARYDGRLLTQIQVDEVGMAHETLAALLDENLREHPKRIVVGAQLVDFGSTAPPK